MTSITEEKKNVTMFNGFETQHQHMGLIKKYSKILIRFRKSTKKANTKKYLMYIAICMK